MRNSLIGGVAILLLALGVFGVTSTIPGCIERDKALKLCQNWCHRVLAEAKIANPEEGAYEADLEVLDPWDGSLHSILHVEELRNTVVVFSSGEDGEPGTRDDITAGDSDIHIRKSVKKGIESGAHSFGKGLTSGVVEGLGNVSEVSVKKAKAGIKKAKDGLMAKFKKKDLEEDE